MQDLNLRPLLPQSSALPDCANARIVYDRAACLQRHGSELKAAAMIPQATAVKLVLKTNGEEFWQLLLIRFAAA